MNNKTKKNFLTFFGIAIFLAMGYLVLKIIGTFFGYISGIPKEVAAPLIAAVATVLVATLTVVVGKYFERKKELDLLHREKKAEIYDEFLKGFFDTFFSTSENSATQSPDDLVKFMRDFMRKLLLWSGPEPIVAFVRWKEHLAKGTPDAQTLFLTEEFIQAIRKDLRHSNEGLTKGFFAKLFLQDGALFLKMAQLNPNITLADLAIIEKEIADRDESMN